MGSREKFKFTTTEGENVYSNDRPDETGERLRKQEENDRFIAKLLQENPVMVPEVYAMIERGEGEFERFKDEYLGRKKGEIIPFPEESKRKKTA